MDDIAMCERDTFKEWLKRLHDDLLMYENMIEQAQDELKPIAEYIREDRAAIDRLLKGEQP